MATYDYKCPEGHRFTIIMSIKEYSDGIDESCPICSAKGNRVYFAPTISVPKGFQADYYPSLGKVFESKRDLDYHLDKNNLVAVGNDFGSGDSMQKHFDQTREYNQKKKWENFDV
jgi:predicted nucleic acid-binding Zn ribbon protein